MSAGWPIARREAQTCLVRRRGEPEVAPQPKPADALQGLQATVGNRGMQQLLGDSRAPIGEGLPLPAALRAEHEQRFGADLFQVRVHDDAGAHRLAQEQSARAFTVGRDIVFNKDFYRPGTLAGRRLIAHELAHVVQQSARGAGGVSGPAHEAAADAAAEAAASGAPGPVDAGPGAVIGVQREPLAKDKVTLNQGQSRAQLPPDTFSMSLQGTTIFYVRGVAVLRFPTVNAGKVKYHAWVDPEHLEVTYLFVRAASDSGARIDQAGLGQIGAYIARLETVSAPLGEQDGGIQLGGIDLTPAKPPPKPVVKAKPAPTAPLPQLPPPEKIEETKTPAADPSPRTPTAELPANAAGAGPAPAPLDLSGRVATIRKNVQSGTFNLFWRQDIVDAFKDLSPDDFRRLQNELSDDAMNAVFEQLSPFLATLIGTYGPVLKGRDKLNQKRVDFIEDIRNWGATRETYYRWMFESMSLDDIHAVLRKLAQDQRLHETILLVPGLADDLIARGVAPSELTEEEIGVFQGIGRGLGHFWDSAWSGTIFANGPGSESTYLPKKYQELYLRNVGQDFEKAMTPGNVVRGTASHVTLGVSDIPVGIYDAVKLTVEAAQDLWNGKSGTAAEKLTPVLLMILAALLGRKISKMGGAGAALEESKGLATAEATALAEPKTPIGGGVPEWDVRQVGKTAAGADRYVGRHASGEFVEIIVDPKNQTIRATRLATGEVVNFDKGQITRGNPPQLTAGDGPVVAPTAPAVGEPVPAIPAAPLVPAPLVPAPKAATVVPPGPAAPPTPAAAPILLLGPGKPQPRVQQAGQRLTQADAAATSARAQASLAQQRVQAAAADLQAAKELKAQAKKSPDAQALVDEAKTGLSQARKELRDLSASSKLAEIELKEAQRTQQRIVQLESDIASLDARIARELNPPGGFSKEAVREGRSPFKTPLPEKRLQPSAAEYHRLADARRAALKELQGETENLARSIAAQIERATPGAEARPAALDNAAKLGGALTPQNGQPIDVTTGQPISASAWATDHLMSRAEIGRDPRFAKATPLQRDALLLEVPENYLPMTAETNSSKGAKSITQWLADRQAAGEELPPAMADALRAADARARAAVEAKFKLFGLSP